jgi:hypothetical protein
MAMKIREREKCREVTKKPFSSFPFPVHQNIETAEKTAAISMRQSIPSQSIEWQ